MKKNLLNGWGRKNKEVTRMSKGRIQKLVISVAIAALLALIMPGMAFARSLEVGEIQTTKAVQYMGVAQNPPTVTPPNEVPPENPPETPPETPPEVPPSTPPDTPPEFPPNTPPETPPTTDQGEEESHVEEQNSEDRQVLPYTGGDSEYFVILGLIVLLLGTAGLCGSVYVMKNEEA